MRRTIRYLLPFLTATCYAFTQLQSAKLATQQLPLRYRTLLYGNLNHNDNEKSKNENNLDLDEETLMQLNEQRLDVWKQRRMNIRRTLKFADNVKNFRLENNIGVDEDSESDDAKFALSITAFVVAVGAVVLRVGGRAALVSGLGLDFMTSDPEMISRLDAFLNWCEGLGPILEPAIFVAAWTAVKVLCFDAGGVVLALASGVLFGGVLQGAFMSAFGATVGSAAAFGLAKIDSPIRKKGLELLEENPSLRGLEKVIAEDGIKAVITLRLAPVLPIPIGAYNYVYGVTNVPFIDFVVGIFVGSLKPYLLDSYLGYFGKSVVDGSIATDTSNDAILLGALGVAVLIGTFASQLASKTFESITAEVEAEKAAKGEALEDEKPMTEIMGMEVPQIIVGLQLALKMAETRLQEAVVTEYNAQVWNMTDHENLPKDIDPAFFHDSPEITDSIGFDVGLALAEGIMLTPVLWETVTKYSDPKYKANNTDIGGDISDAKRASLVSDGVSKSTSLSFELESTFEEDKSTSIMVKSNEQSTATDTVNAVVSSEERSNTTMVFVNNELLIEDLKGKIGVIRTKAENLLALVNEELSDAK